MNLEEGQKQLMSLFELHFGTKLSQVFRHCGTTLGQGASMGIAGGRAGVEGPGEFVTGKADDEEDAADTDGTGYVLGGVGKPVVSEIPDESDGGRTEHPGHTVPVVVTVIVETVLVVYVISVVPEVIVPVTGQVVTVVYVLYGFYLRP